VPAGIWSSSHLGLWRWPRSLGANVAWLSGATTTPSFQPCSVRWGTLHLDAWGQIRQRRWRLVAGDLAHGRFDAHCNATVFSGGRRIPVSSLFRGISSLTGGARRPGLLGSCSGVDGGGGLDGSVGAGWPPSSTGGGRPGPSDAQTAGRCLGGRSG
jgi:hypothetical protein